MKIDMRIFQGSNAVITYDVRLGYKTDQMEEDPNSDWKLDVQSRESRSIRCQPVYYHRMENQVYLTRILLRKSRLFSRYRIHPMHMIVNH